MNADQTEDRSTSNADRGKLLEVLSLHTHFFTDQGVIPAVDGISFWIERGQTLGLVGESGCGKSMTALSILRLVSPPGRIVGGRILFEGRNLLDLSPREMQDIRGNRIAMIFQEPMSSLNPVFTAGSQIAEVIRIHRPVSRGEARLQAIELLERVKIPSAAKCYDAYPHQMSGGMRQRVMIAMALACQPSLLIADEPTTSLDVTIQAEIMELLAELQQEFRMSVLLITHNLALVAEVAHWIAVMYASRVVEVARARDLFSNPLHPYTHGLLNSVPRLGISKKERLSVIPGAVPDPRCFPRGCRFHPRCSAREEICSSQEPLPREVKSGHTGWCHLIRDAKGPLSRKQVSS